MLRLPPDISHTARAQTTPRMHKGNCRNQVLQKRLKRIWILLLLPIALLSLFVASRSQEAAEHVFARGIFVGLSWVMSHITGLLPFSLMELGILALLPLTLFFIIFFAVRLIIKKEDRPFRIAKAFLNVGCIFSVVFFLLVFGCSINYYRYPVAAYLGLTVNRKKRFIAFLPSILRTRQPCQHNF